MLPSLHARHGLLCCSQVPLRSVSRIHPPELPSSAARSSRSVAVPPPPLLPAVEGDERAVHLEGNAEELIGHGWWPA
nr:unnamed protein product [Digitaria exilis]